MSALSSCEALKFAKPGLSLQIRIGIHTGALKCSVPSAVAFNDFVDCNDAIYNQQDETFKKARSNERTAASSSGGIRCSWDGNGISPNKKTEVIDLCKKMRGYFKAKLDKITNDMEEKNTLALKAGSVMFIKKTWHGVYIDTKLHQIASDYKGHYVKYCDPYLFFSFPNPRRAYNFAI